MLRPSPFVWKTLLIASFGLPWATAGARSKTPQEKVDTFPPDAQASLVHVIDGDTAWFRLATGALVKARLAGINAPECHKRDVTTRDLRSAMCVSDDETYGMAAAATLRQLLGAGSIRLNCARTASNRCQVGGFGRPLTTVVVNGKDVASEMVRAGSAWTYTKYPDKHRGALCAIEAKARAEGAGMWRAGVDRVRAGMSPKTRRWFEGQASACAAAK